MDLESEGGKERTDENEGGGNEHPAFAGEFVGCVAEKDDANDGADEQSIGNPGLDGRGVGFCAEEVVEDDVGAGCLWLLFKWAGLWEMEWGCYIYIPGFVGNHLRDLLMPNILSVSHFLKYVW